MEQQILVVVAIGRQQMREEQIENLFRLTAIAKGISDSCSKPSFDFQKEMKRSQGRGVFSCSRTLKASLQAAGIAHVRLAGGKIEIPEHPSQVPSPIEFCQQLVHATVPSPIPRSIGSTLRIPPRTKIRYEKRVL